MTEPERSRWRRYRPEIVAWVGLMLLVLALVLFSQVPLWLSGATALVGFTLVMGTVAADSVRMRRQSRAKRVGGRGGGDS